MHEYKLKLHYPEKFNGGVVLMKARKVLSFIIAVIAVCISSCAYANISPDVAAEDPRIKPFISATKENGAELLP